MLTDGDWNLGPSPIGVATRFRDQGIPVYSIVTGQDQPIADLSMEEVSAPAYGLLANRSPSPTRCKSHLPRDVATEVRLMNGRDIIASKKITLPANGQFRDSIMWYPREVGEFDLRLDIPVEVDEALRDNNSADFHIAVRVVKLSVLVVDSEPRWGIPLPAQRTRPRSRRRSELRVAPPKDRPRRRPRLSLLLPRLARDALAIRRDLPRRRRGW